MSLWGFSPVFQTKAAPVNRQWPNLHHLCISAFEFHPSLVETVEVHHPNRSASFDLQEYQKFRNQFEKEYQGPAAKLPVITSFEGLVAFLDWEAKERDDTFLKWMERLSPAELGRVRNAFQAKNVSQLARSWAKLHLEYYRALANSKDSLLKRWGGGLARKFLGPSAEENLFERQLLEILETRLLYAEAVALFPGTKPQGKFFFWKLEKFWAVMSSFSMSLRLFFSSVVAVTVPGWLPIEWLELMSGSGSGGSVLDHSANGATEKLASDTQLRLLLQNSNTIEWEVRSQYAYQAGMKTIIGRMKRAVAVAVLAALSASVSDWIAGYQAVQPFGQVVSEEKLKQIEDEKFDAAAVRKEQVEEWKAGYEKFYRSKLKLSKDAPFPWDQSPHKEKLIEFEGKMAAIPDESLRVYTFK